MKNRRLTLGFTLFTLIAACIFAFLSHYIAVNRTGTPPTMPKDSKFIAGDFEYTRMRTRGEWVSCHSDIKSPTDWCRIANQSGDILFEGKFLPLGQDQPLPDSQIKIATYNIDNHWVIGPTETFKVPVVPLEGGAILVPFTDTHTLAARWKAHPEEQQAILKQGPA
jgi:hypothetical protein